MSKGKRKSDPEALRIVRQRLRCRQARFTEQDREWLMKLCRVDLIQILEVDLDLGPLKASQKNSVASMINFLLGQQAQASEASGLVALDVDRNDQAPTPGPCDPQQQEPDYARQGVAPACAGLIECPSSGGGSCHTPDTADEQQPQQLGQMLSGTVPAAAAAPGPYPDEPWLAELQQQLVAAGNIRNMGEDTTDTDDDTNGTEADSSWMPSQSGMLYDLDMPMLAHNLHDQPPGTAAAAAAALDTTQIEEMLVQQLLLDIEGRPKSRRERFPNCGISRPQQQQERQPPPLLQQKLLELDQQQQMLKQQQQLQQQLQIQQEQQQQLLQLHQQLLQQQPVHGPFNIEEVLETELLQQLHSNERLQYVQLQLQQQLGEPMVPSAAPEDVVGGSPAAGVAAINPDDATVAAIAFPLTYTGMLQQQQQLLQEQVLQQDAFQQQQQHQQRSLQLEQLLLSQSPQQNASWPLTFAQPHSSTAAGAGSGCGAVQCTTAAGLPLFGLSDTPLAQAVQGASRLAPRVSYDGAGSFTRKRDKLWMDLPAVQDESLAGAADAGELCVELSGPSTEQPTKRMSITLPGSTQVASLPTSFSGKLGVGTTERALPGDMDQHMQLSGYEEPSSMRWQHQQQVLGGQPSAQQQQQQQYHNHHQQQQVQQGGQESVDLASDAHQGLGSRLKMLLRGKKAKARRSLTVGAGGSFCTGTATAAAGTTRIPSADAVLAMRKASAGSTGQFVPQAPLAAMQQPQQQQQQQHCGDAGAAGCAEPPGSVQGGFLLQESTPHAPVDRQWHSLFMPPAPCDPHTVQATVGGLSWHADISTGVAGVQGCEATAAGMQQMPGHQSQWQGMEGCVSKGQHPAAAAAPRIAELPAGSNVGLGSGDGGFAQQLALLRATYASQLLEGDEEFANPSNGGVADPAGLQDLQMPPPPMLAGDMGLPGGAVSTGGVRQGESPFGAGAAGLGLAEGALGSLRDVRDDRPGFVGRLTRALKLGSSRSSQNLDVLLQPAASTNMDEFEQEEDLMITGRCDGELQLARAALQWQAGGDVSTHDFVAALHAGGLGSAGGILEQGMQE